MAQVKAKKKTTLKDYTGEVKSELHLDPHSCALIAAARRGDVVFGMLAMDAGDTINTVNNDEETALHIALDNGHQDFALWLLARGECPIYTALRQLCCCSNSGDFIGCIQYVTSACMQVPTRFSKIFAAKIAGLGLLKLWVRYI